MISEERFVLAGISDDLAVFRQYSMSRIIPFVAFLLFVDFLYMRYEYSNLYYISVLFFGMSVVFVFIWIGMILKPKSEVPYLAMQYVSIFLCLMFALSIFLPEKTYHLGYSIIQNLVWVQGLIIFSILNSLHVIYWSSLRVFMLILTAITAASILMLLRGNGNFLAVLSLSNIVISAWATIFGSRQFITRKDLHVKQSARISALEHLVNSDMLTGLPNRRSLYSTVGNYIDRGIGEFAVAIIDIDNFKAINDTLGHTSGDALIVSFSRFLNKHCREKNIVARISGDEFAIVFPELTADNALQLCNEIQSDLRRTDALDHMDKALSRITTSIGIAMYPRDGISCEDLIKHADSAMYDIKKSGKNNIAVYNKSVHSIFEQQQDIVHELALAIERNELYYEVQPIYDNTGSRIIKAEMLMRWNSEKLGSIPPAQFIPLAESSGLIIQMGWWILNQGCLLSASVPDIKICVNISVAQLIYPGFMDGVNEILRESSAAPSSLALEITETFILQNNPIIADVMDEISGAGLDIIIDDFGVGYSNYDRLKNLPIACIKIDKVFVDSLLGSAIDQEYTKEIIGSLVRLGKTGHFTITAEGIEAVSQLEALRELGCHSIQGYLLARPMLPANFIKIVQQSYSAG
ncbi:EAL domain-containing protein [Deinococcus sp. KNUC1210]|uniref:putative bifunctional diguanylate cyclase/phosphodiesterase n=1 Tax=Deinococcus sp. KNUC1210 TaxID=2917691 RepID=UPI001EF0AD9C|nr:GGDEF domain-containing phosphodiesterase [Deinococcus sp. KNUC1210]ULH15046.1 EAL domain-containing protein [Deinococcus sp. KNUC1210]